VIRVAIVDDHPALRAGLRTILEAEPGMAFAGESSGEPESLWPLLHRACPDVVLLDYHLPRGDGLQLCYRIKREVPSPRVILFSAYAGAALALPAALAGADGLLPKGVDARELFEAVRLAHAGERLIPPVSRTVLAEACADMEPPDQALVGMLLDGASEAEAARTLDLDAPAVRRTVQRVLGQLRVEVPAPRA